LIHANARIRKPTYGALKSNERFKARYADLTPDNLFGVRFGFPCAIFGVFGRLNHALLCFLQAF
jgi:hypothetical protein